MTLKRWIAGTLTVAFFTAVSSTGFAGEYSYSLEHCVPGSLGIFPWTFCFDDYNVDNCYSGSADIAQDFPGGQFSMSGRYEFSTNATSADFSFSSVISAYWGPPDVAVEVDARIDSGQFGRELDCGPPEGSVVFPAVGPTRIHVTMFQEGAASDDGWHLAGLYNPVINYGNGYVDFPGFLNGYWETDADVVANGRISADFGMFHQLLVSAGPDAGSFSYTCSGNMHVDISPSILPVAVDAKPGQFGATVPDAQAYSDPSLSLMVFDNLSRTAAVADGVTRVLLRCMTGGAGTATFATSGNLPGEKMTRVDSDAAPAVGVQTVFWRNLTNYAFAVYTVPDGFPASGDVQSVENDFIVTFTPANGGAPITRTIPFKLVRPPVVLVHGLWSGRSKWTAPDGPAMCVPASTSTATFDTLIRNGFVVRVADYSAHNADHFIVNQYAVWQPIAQVIADYNAQKIAITQVDLIGHSMGGIVARYFAQTPEFRDQNQNYGKGYIRRFITLGTPHLGSDLALYALVGGTENRYWLEALRDFMDYIASPPDHLPIDRGAIADLIPGSGALNAIRETKIPCHAIVCEASPGNDYFWDCIQRLGYYHLFDVRDYNYSSPAALINSIFFCDQNDRVVQATSQRGGLPDANVTVIPGPTHSDEPGDQNVANRIVELLTIPKDGTFAESFPGVQGLSANVGCPESAAKLREPPFLPDYPRALDAAQLIVMTSPITGQSLTAGTNVVCTVQATGQGSVGSVFIMYGGDDLSMLNITNLPYTFTVSIPSNYQGGFTFVASATDSEGNVSTNPVVDTVYVNSTAHLTNITATPANLVINDFGEPVAISVSGQFDDGSTHDITAPQSGTTYSSSWTNVATVAPDGKVMAAGYYNGTGQIDVTNGTNSISIPFTVTLLLPAVFSATTLSGGPGQTNMVVELFGLHFGIVTNLYVTGANGPDPNIRIQNWQVNSDGTILTINLWVSPDADVGPRSAALLTARGPVSSGFAGFVSGFTNGARWTSRQRDLGNMGRADFIVPASRMNGSFFGLLRWQTPSPNTDNNIGASSILFCDNAGPGGSDLAVCGYHWPKGIQGMDRHNGKVFWHGNPGDGGEAIGDNCAGFSPDGRTIYAVNDSTPNDGPLIGFDSVVGPATFWDNRSNASPDHLSAFSPKVAPDGRVVGHQWDDRPYGASDTGSSIIENWAALMPLSECYSEPALFVGAEALSVIATGRVGNIADFDGYTGAVNWEAQTGLFTDADPTVDATSGNVYVPMGQDSVWIVGLSQSGRALWNNLAMPVFTYQPGTNNPQRAQSAGCLSFDGSTYYFQTVSQQGDGRLYAINTTNGALKWSFPTGSMGWEESVSSPIVTANDVLIVGNNHGGKYIALHDDETNASLFATLPVADETDARSSATLSPDGLLYLPARLLWTVSNGDADPPTRDYANLFNAFDVGTLAPSITGAGVNADGSVSLSLYGLPGLTHRLWAAESLTPPVVWQPIQTNAVGGAWLFTDTTAGSYPARFYRISSP